MLSVMYPEFVDYLYGGIGMKRVAVLLLVCTALVVFGCAGGVNRVDTTKTI